jgi:hypothetical protein
LTTGSGQDWRIGGGYVFDVAKVTEYNPIPAPIVPLVGKYIAQVPTHRGSVRVSYSNLKYATVAFDVEAMSPSVRGRSESARRARRRAG